MYPGVYNKERVESIHTQGCGRFSGARFFQNGKAAVNTEYQVPSKVFSENTWSRVESLPKIYRILLIGTEQGVFGKHVVESLSKIYRIPGTEQGVFGKHVVETLPKVYNIRV